VALPGLVRGKLHRGCKKSIFVTGDVAFQQGHDVAGGGHRLSGRRLAVQRLRRPCLTLTFQLRFVSINRLFSLARKSVIAGG
jgi:hypothetical protein